MTTDPTDPIEPATPARTPWWPWPTRRERIIAFELCRILLTIVIATFIGTLILARGGRDIESELHQGQARIRRLEGQVQALHDEVVKQAQADATPQADPMVPPTNDKLFTVLAKGLGVTEAQPRTTTVGTTPDAAFATDLTSAQKSDAYTQEILIQNIEASSGNTLCVGYVAWVNGQTCATTCAAASLTCSGAATDGVHIAPQVALPARRDGTNCVCVVGSAASTDYQSMRSIR